MGSRVCYGCKNLLEAVVDCKLISSYAFYNCKSLAQLMFSNQITTVPDYCFYGCEVLTDQNLFKNLTTIGNYSFYGCNFPKFDIYNVTSIGDYAFGDCNGIDTINLRSVQAIGNGAFSYCTKLKELTIPANCNSVGTHLCQGDDDLTTVVFGKDFFVDCLAVCFEFLFNRHFYIAEYEYESF